MGFQWRRLQFFERELVQDPEVSLISPQANVPAPPPTRLFRSFSPSCCASGRGTVVFGDNKGVIRVLDRNLNPITFDAYDSSVVAVQQMRRSAILATLGLDSGTGDASIKFWRFDGRDGQEAVCVKVLRLFSNKAAEQNVVGFAVLEDFTQAAVGLANGSVLVLTAPNLLRDRSHTTTCIIKQGPEVTSLIYREDPSLPSLFVVTRSTVSSVFVSRREAHVQLIDPAVGAAPGCACLNDSKQLVAGGEAVFFYDQEERSVCYGLTEKKRQVLWFNGYLVLIGPDEVPADAPPRDLITVYDLKHKLIAYSAKLDPVRFATTEWNALLVLTAAGQMIRFTELDMTAKMDILFKKSLFVVAIALAGQQSDRGYVLRIHQQYGDHLFAKGDYDGAVTQYIEAIPRSEPSAVIRKLLDPQHARRLTRYLAALRDSGRSTGGHLLLLLSCYAQLKCVAELTAFVSAPAPAELDAAATVGMLISSGHPLHALRLAHVHGLHDLYISTLAGAVSGTAALAGHSTEGGSAEAAAAVVSDAAGMATLLAGLAPTGGPIATAVRYISSLPAAAASAALLANGTVLLRRSRALPLNHDAAAVAASVAASAGNGKNSDGLLELCLRLCTRWVPAPPPPLPRLPNETDAAYDAAVARMDQSGPVRARARASDASAAAGEGGAGSLDDAAAYSTTVSTAAAAAAADADSEAANRPADPLALAPLFVAHPLLLERFYETLLSYDMTYCGGTLLSPAVIGALLEVYLSINKAAADAARAAAAAGTTVPATTEDGMPALETRESQIMTLLRTHSQRLDLAQALVLCEAMDFEKGLLYLHGKLERYQDVAHHYMERGQHSKLIKTCRKYGETDPSLWISALVHFASQQGAFEEELAVVLDNITRQGLMAPLVILQLLARSPTKPISVVRPFLLRALQEEAAVAAEDQRETERYEADTRAMASELETVRGQATIFKEVDCNRCNNTLSLPAVHFLCMHSFHAQCVADTAEKECPICAPEHRKVAGLRESLRRSAKQHDKFFKQLEDSHDGFATVAEYFGRGAFDHLNDEE